MVNKEFRMIKNAFLVLIIFVFGFTASEFYRSELTPIHNDTQVEPAKDVVSNLSTDVLGQSLDKPLSKAEQTTKPSSKLDLKNVNRPKTSYEVFKLLMELDSSSAKDLEAYLATLGRDNPEVRNQVAWLLSAKYPTHALDYITTLLNSGDIDLSKVVLQSVGQNHAKLAWDWVKANEKEMDSIYKNIAEKYDAKLLVLNMLARVPEEKWLAYEEAKNVIANGPQKADKYRLMTVANNTASSDPEDAISYAMSGVNGKRDSDLFNGAIVNLIDKDIFRAKELILQNQDIADMSSVNTIAQKLIKNNQFSDVYNLANGFHTPELQKSALQSLGSMLISNGLDRTKEFAATIRSDDLRYEIVRGMVISMAVNGQPVKDQLALMDSAMVNIPVEKKDFTYAYTMRDWPTLNSTEYNNYMSDLRSRDKSLAEAIEIKSKYIQKN